MSREREIRVALAGLVVTAAAAMVPACGGQPPDVASGEAAAVTVSGGPLTQRACPTAPGKIACAARAVVNANGAVQPFTVPTGFGPADLQSAYNVTGAAPAVAPTIAVIDAYDDSHAESDLAEYRSTFGLAACTTANGCFTKVNQQGTAVPLPAPSPPADDWSYEVSLDLDIASAICPTCRLLLVEANDDVGDGLFVSVNTAATLGASVISAPWGLTEATTDPTNDSYFDHPGIAIFSIAGDSGYGTVEFPGSSPYVIAVGGTTLVKSATTPRGWTETAWSDGGSGCSKYQPKPAWQKDTGCANRTTADVAAVADPATPVAIYDSTGGGWSQVGGTVVAENVVAAIFARTGHAAATASLAYQNETSFYDVTSGTNGTCTPGYLCTAGAGYDGPTGVGSPNAAALAKVSGNGSSNPGADSGAAACAHPECSAGAELASECDPCVTKICAADSSCCTTSWDRVCVAEVSSVCGESCSGACAHNECAAGEKLASGCDPCVTKICAADSSCCAHSWDAVCVREVATICRETCK
jgi:hypothetical protein